MAYAFYILWAAPHVCLAASFVLLLRRGAHRQLPLFSAYVAFQVFEFVELLLVAAIASKISRAPLHIYRSFGVASLTISTTLEFLALFELTKELTLPPELIRKVVPVFRWVAAVLVLSAAALSAQLLANGAEQLMTIFQTLEFSANLVKLGLLLLVLICTIGLKIPWKSLPAGLVLGFGIQSSAEMGASALYSALGKPGFITVDMIRMVAFLFCTIVWLVYIVRPEKTPEFKGAGLRLSELELLDQQMQKMMRP